MYTIKHAADRTGIPVATLRAWERRYGVVTPQRAGSGYRLYDEGDLRTLTMMRDLVDAGWSPQQAAHKAGRALAAAPALATASTGDGPPEPPAGSEPLTRFGTPQPDMRSPATPRISFTEFVTAARDLDATRLTELLDDRFSRGSFETVVDNWLMPALEEIGNAWAEGRITVAGEHLVTCAVHRRLATAYEAAAHNPHSDNIIVGLPPDARHELGILAFATAARRAGLSVTYLGADLPAQDWATAVTCNDARYAVLSLSRAQNVIELNAVVSTLEHDTPGTRIAVGGRHQNLAPATVHRLGHRIGPAAEWLAHDVKTLRRQAPTDTTPQEQP